VNKDIDIDCLFLHDAFPLRRCTFLQPLQGDTVNRKYLHVLLRLCCEFDSLSSCMLYHNNSGKTWIQSATWNHFLLNYLRVSYRE